VHEKFVGKKLSIVMLKYVKNKNACNSSGYSLFTTDAKKRINVSEKACYVFICTKMFAKKNYHPIVSKDDITITVKSVINYYFRVFSPLQ